MAERKVRIGIIGCGGIANGKHMPSLKKVPGVKMVAFCDIVVERAEKAKKEYSDVKFILYGPFQNEVYKIAGRYRMRYLIKNCGKSAYR